MYVPRHFAEDDHAPVLELVRRVGFGQLVVSAPDGFEASPIPFLVDDAITSVRAHVARPNPIWRLAPCAAILIVAGPDAYVSPSWYVSKQEHGKVVPTWNYDVVHLHGSLVVHDDDGWLAEQMRELTDHHEFDMAAPWSVDDPPAGYVATARRGTVGLELRVDRVDAKRKLSQNKSAADAAGAADGLDALGGDDRGRVAAAMRDQHPEKLDEPAG